MYCVTGSCALCVLGRLLFLNVLQAHASCKSLPWGMACELPCCLLLMICCPSSMVCCHGVLPIVHGVLPIVHGLLPILHGLLTAAGACIEVHGL